MGNIVMNKERLINLAKKHKKTFETYSIKRYAYLVNEKPFYFCRYNSKYGDKKVKGYAIISPDSNNNTIQMKALEPLIEYSVSIHNIMEVGGYRSKVNFTVFYEVQEYLRRIVEEKVVHNEKDKIYKRSLSVLENMINVQQKLVGKYKEALNKYDLVKEKGFITDVDIKEIKSYIPLLMWLQYKQYIDRYDNRTDFDVIYENRNNKEVKQFENFSDPRTLKQMTTKVAEKEMEEGLSRVSYNKNLRDLTEEQYNQVVYDKFHNGLEELIREVKSQLRNT